jgi:hypothetical protein
LKISLSYSILTAGKWRLNCINYRACLNRQRSRYKVNNFRLSSPWMRTFYSIFSSSSISYGALESGSSKRNYLYSWSQYLKRVSNLVWEKIDWPRHFACIRRMIFPKWLVSLAQSFRQKHSRRNVIIITLLSESLSWCFTDKIAPLNVSIALIRLKFLTFISLVPYILRRALQNPFITIKVLHSIRTLIIVALLFFLKTAKTWFIVWLK